jgi:hypothetical protein
MLTCTPSRKPWFVLRDRPVELSPMQLRSLQWISFVDLDR